eukprot:m.21399 g.21399  ORF g.21399 m.21399 type:complete len:238 (+) comp11137_c0_seq1:227-940(+)
MCAAKVCRLTPLGLPPLSLQECQTSDADGYWSCMDDDYPSEFEDSMVEEVQWQAELDEEYQIHVASALSVLSNCREQDRLQNPDKRKFSAAQLLPHVILGDGEDAMDLDMLTRLGVSAVVNCAASSTLTGQTNYPPHFAYLAFDALDQPEYDLLGQHFDAFSQFLEEARRQNRVVFVHCQAGVNRSASLCVAYLMLLQHIPLVQAIEHCARLRPCILRNEGFIEQLVVFASAHDALG